eukprot:Gb_16897 [translate_table: standard]
MNVGYEEGQRRSLHVKPPKGQNYRKHLELVSVMGGEPVTIEPTVLVVDKEVKNILEEAGLLAFFKEFRGHSESITNQFVDTWKDGRVVIDKIKILVNATLIAEVSSLLNDGEVISREKMNQGLMKMIVDFSLSKKPSVAGPSKGGFTRVSGTPITKSQLLLGPIPTASHIDFGDSVSEVEGESESQEKGSLIKNPKDKGGRKKKLPAQVLKTSEEERKSDEPSLPGDKNNPQKGYVASPYENFKSPGDPLLLTEELRCHLIILNSLGSSLLSMRAYVNLMTLEITNYLKEVLKFMKEKNVEKE